ncbi:hypothetical protein V5O48_014178 [Marasmius crinis-equi]|uniref:Uncharacterized protein n=1 Tax=Marasmius crinis-equi TaxID=585013 RepID=A0ABR3EY42_9AGAR
MSLLSKEMNPVNSSSTSLDEKKREDPWRFRKRKSTATDVSISVLTTLKEVSQAAGGISYLGIAAAIALEIVNAAQGAKDNRDSFKRLACDACSLVVNIAAVCDELVQDEEKEISPSLKRHLETLTETLNQIKTFAQKRAEKAYWKRFISSQSDLDRIKEFRERLAQAVDLFGVQSHITVRESIARLATRQQSFHDEFKNYPGPRQASPEPLSPLTESPTETEYGSNNPFRSPTPPTPTPKPNSTFDDAFKDFLSSSTVTGTIVVNNIAGNNHTTTTNTSNFMRPT